MLNLKFKCKLLDDGKEKKALEIFKSLIIGFICEFIGTYLLTYFICSCSSVIDTLIGISLCCGLIIGAIIQGLACVTLGQINPAVSLSLFIFGVISLLRMFVYWIAQCLGAIIGAYIAEVLMDKPIAFCCTLPALGNGPIKTIFIEFMLTSALILVVCSMADGRNENKLDSLTLKFGVVIAGLVYCGAPYTGTSINPARSLGPALIGNKWTQHWAYWVGPLLGSAFTSVFYHIFFLPENGQEHLIKSSSKNEEPNKE